MAENNHVIVQNGEVDLVSLFRVIWDGRKFAYKTAGAFAILGIIISLISPVEYEASSKLLPESPESSSSKMGGLSGLAGLAGIDIGGMSGSSSSIITPTLYPEIVNSVPFMLEVMNDSIYFEQKKLKTTPFYYFKEIAPPTMKGILFKLTIGIPGMIKRSILGKKEVVQRKDSEYHRISREEWLLIQGVKDRITVSINEDNGIISIRTEMPDPYAAAQLAKKIELLITKAVENYATEKAKRNLNYVQSAYNTAQKEYEAVQVRQARIIDRNRNVSSALAQVEIKKVEQDYELTFGVFKSIASQLEQAKLKVNQETPVFTVLEPVRIPAERSRPKRTLMVIAFTFVSFFFSSIFLVAKNIIKNIKHVQK